MNNWVNRIILEIIVTISANFFRAFSFFLQSTFDKRLEGLHKIIFKHEKLLFIWILSVATLHGVKLKSSIKKNKKFLITQNTKKPDSNRLFKLIQIEGNY